MLARTVGKTAQAQVFAHGIQSVLHVLRVGRGPLVDDHQIGRDATGTQIFLRTQRFAGDAEIDIVVDANGEDREVAGDRQRPERGLRAKTGLHRRRIGSKLHVGIDEIAAEHLETCRFLRGDRRHGASAPGCGSRRGSARG